MISADEQQALHNYLRHAEDLARHIRVTSGGALTLAVVNNHGVTRAERQGIGWDDAHDMATALRPSDPAPGATQAPEEAGHEQAG